VGKIDKEWSSGMVVNTEVEGLSPSHVRVSTALLPAAEVPHALESPSGAADHTNDQATATVCPADLVAGARHQTRVLHAAFHASNNCLASSEDDVTDLAHHSSCSHACGLDCSCPHLKKNLVVCHKNVLDSSCEVTSRVGMKPCTSQGISSGDELGKPSINDCAGPHIRPLKRQEVSPEISSDDHKLKRQKLSAV